MRHSVRFPNFSLNNSKMMNLGKDNRNLKIKNRRLANQKSYHTLLHLKIIYSFRWFSSKEIKTNCSNPRINLLMTFGITAIHSYFPPSSSWTEWISFLYLRCVAIVFVYTAFLTYFWHKRIEESIMQFQLVLTMIS